jgi:NADPH2:quinone reductase
MTPPFGMFSLVVVRAIQQTEFGGPEVLRLVDIPQPEPGPDEVSIEVSGAGVNFADVHAREDKYLDKQSLPLVPGSEVVGIRADSGARVVAYCGTGGYAEFATAARDRVFEIPDAVSDEIALALLVQGVTAFHLYATAAQPRPGAKVLVISGAGGTGSLLIQLARSFGAETVIATASSAEKRALCEELGADVAIDGAPEGLAERITAAAGGPVDVIFEPSGGAVFEAAREALAHFGRLVVYGIASGEPNELRTSRLLRASHTVAGFRLAHALEHPEMVAVALASLFTRVIDGELEVQIGGVYPLAEAADVQRALAGRKTTGKLILNTRST